MQKYLVRGVSPPILGPNIVAQRAKGLYVWDTEGREYIDITTGIGVCSLGHCHPAVTAAAQAQCAKVQHAQMNCMYHEPMLELIGRMKEKLHPSLDSFMFRSTGAEAVEDALKVARAATGKTNVICLQGGFHGRTFGTMSLTTSKNIYHRGLHPMLGGIHVVPFPFAQQMLVPLDTPPQEICAKALTHLEDVLHQATSPDDVGALIMEPTLGEGGYLACPKWYVEGVAKICKENNILLIFDEVQAGIGRTGTLFAYEQYSVVPDIMVFAKGIAGGFPLSGIVTKKELADKQLPGTMGGTYAGNAVACAAANAVLKAFDDEQILKNVSARSKQFYEGLQSIAQRNSAITELRGPGLMIGLHFKDSVPGQAKAVASQCMKNRLMILPCSKFEVLRFIPPLNITEKETSTVLEVFDKSLKELGGLSGERAVPLRSCCSTPCMKENTLCCRYY